MALRRSCSRAGAGRYKQHRTSRQGWQPGSRTSPWLSAQRPTRQWVVLSRRKAAVGWCTSPAWRPGCLPISAWDQSYSCCMCLGAGALIRSVPGRSMRSRNRRPSLRQHGTLPTPVRCMLLAKFALHCRQLAPTCLRDRQRSGRRFCFYLTAATCGTRHSSGTQAPQDCPPHWAFRCSATKIVSVPSWVAVSAPVQCSTSKVAS